MKHAEFTTIEAYNIVNMAIANYKDSLTKGEYSRTETSYEYNPNPEPYWNGKYYMPAKPDQVEVGLFEGVTLLDAIPIEPEAVPTMEWLKADIQEWLTNHKIEWTTSMNKEELIALIQ